MTVAGELFLAQSLAGVLTQVNRAHLGAGILPDSCRIDSSIVNLARPTGLEMVHRRGMIVNLNRLARRHAVPIRLRSAEAAPRHEGVVSVSQPKAKADAHRAAAIHQAKARLIAGGGWQRRPQPQ